jgi:hypothetical protein
MANCDRRTPTLILFNRYSFFFFLVKIYETHTPDTIRTLTCRYSTLIIRWKITESVLCWTPTCVRYRETPNPRSVRVYLQCLNEHEKKKHAKNRTEENLLTKHGRIVEFCKIHFNRKQCY